MSIFNKKIIFYVSLLIIVVLSGTLVVKQVVAYWIDYAQDCVYCPPPYEGTGYCMITGTACNCGNCGSLGGEEEEQTIPRACPDGTTLWQTLCTSWDTRPSAACPEGSECCTTFASGPCPGEPEPDPDCEITILSSGCSSSGGGSTVYPGETATVQYRLTHHREDHNWTWHGIKGKGSGAWQTLIDTGSQEACVCDEPAGYWNLMQRTFSFSELYNKVDNGFGSNIKVTCDTNESDLSPCPWCSTCEPYEDIARCTLATEPNPEAPTLTHSTITETSIKWDWTHTRGAVAKYQICDDLGTILWDNLELDTYCGGDVIGNACSFTEPGLIANTLYSRRVRAVNSYGDKDSNLDSATTLTGDPTTTGHIRIQGPSGIIKLAVISAADAIDLGRGVVKVVMSAGDINSAAWLVETTDPEASPVRIMTPYGIKAWRELP